MTLNPLRKFNVVKRRFETGKRGYTVTYPNGRPVMIGFGEANWFPKKREALAYKKECESE